MASPPEFSLFPNLPLELRTKIWKESLPGPRVVPVWYNRRQKRYTSDLPPPLGLLHACSESRTIFFSLYENFKLSPKYESSIYLDFSRDTIFFDRLDCSPHGDLALDLSMSPHRDKVLACAIDSQLWEVLRVFRYDSLSEVKLLRNLKTIALVLKNDFDRAVRTPRIRLGGIRETVFPGSDSNTLGSEIKHVNWYVESLRWELEHELKLMWLNGKQPSVQMWIF